MSDAGPELIFVAGLQRGQRVLVVKDVVLLGGAANCDVVLTEEFASRQHLKLSDSDQGWVVENLSSAVTRINGKKFKQGKKLLLETGDMLGAGAGTEILFVAPGDDVEEALRTYQQAHPDMPDAVTAALPGTPPAGFAQPAQTPETPAKPAINTQQKAQRDKLRKYAVFGGVWVLVVGLVFTGLYLVKLHKNGQDVSPVYNSSGPELFGGKDMDNALKEIAQAIGAPILRDASNSTKAAENLREAEAVFDRRNLRIGDLQKCVKYFKLHLAYSRNPEFETPQQADQFQTAQKDLINAVSEIYKQGWIHEEDTRWDLAEKAWQMLLAVLPHDEEWDSKPYQALVDNIFSHSSYAHQHAHEKRTSPF